MASQPQQLPPPNSARLAITSLCNVLRTHGVTCLEPETIRQAKFDGPVAGALWRGLHDTILVVMAGCPACPAAPATPPGTSFPPTGTSAPFGFATAGAAALSGALSRQWSQVELEAAAGAGEGEFPAEGVALVLHLLAAWGAPPDLLRLLQPPAEAYAAADSDATARLGGRAQQPRVRPRPLLLALGWLVAAAGLFERRIAQLEPGAEVRALLPPYPQDSCNNPAVHAAYEAAASEARDHVQRLVPSPTTATSTAAAAAGSASTPQQRRCRTASSGDPFGPSAAAVAAEAVWGQVEAAAQRAVALCGRVRSRMVVLQSATDCRHRLSHTLWTRQAAAAPSARPLTPYELQLCASSAAVQRHMSALEAATLALLEQQELAAHGELFFEWLGSVMQEEQQAAQGQQHPDRKRGQHLGPSGANHPPSSGSGASLASLEQLPYVGSTAGGRLASHLEAQLEAVVKAADPELSAAANRRRAAAAAAAPQNAERASAAAVSMQLFLSLAEQAVSERPAAFWESPPSASADGEAPAATADVRASGAATAAAYPSGVLPPLPPPPPSMDLAEGIDGGAAAAGPWRLPEDVAAAVAAVHEAQRRRQCTAAEEAERFQQLRYAALSRYDFGGGAGGPLAAVLAAAAGTGGGAGGAAAVPPVSSAAETQRLLAAVLAAARPLARTRAAHKATLLAALGDLPEGYMVAGV